MNTNIYAKINAGQSGRCRYNIENSHQAIMYYLYALIQDMPIQHLYTKNGNYEE